MVQLVQKPPLGTPIDPSHPLSVGLVADYALSEGAGSKVYNAANPADSYGAVSASLPSWVQTKYGSAPSFTAANSQYFQGRIAKPLGRNSPPWTVMARWLVMPTNGVAQVAFGLGDATTTYGRQFCVEQVGERPGGFISAGSVAVTLTTANNGTYLGQIVTVALISRSPSDHTVYLFNEDGLQETFTSNTDISKGSGYPALGGPINIGAQLDKSHVNSGANGPVIWGKAWKRALTLDEVRQVYDDPFAHYQRELPISFFVTSGPSTVALLARSMIGARSRSNPLVALPITGRGQTAARVRSGATYPALLSTRTRERSAAKAAATAAASLSTTARVATRLRGSTTVGAALISGAARVVTRLSGGAAGKTALSARTRGQTSTRTVMSGSTLFVAGAIRAMAKMRAGSAATAALRGHSLTVTSARSAARAATALSGAARAASRASARLSPLALLHARLAAPTRAHGAFQRWALLSAAARSRSVARAPIDITAALITGGMRIMSSALGRLIITTGVRGVHIENESLVVADVTNEVLASADVTDETLT